VLDNTLVPLVGSVSGLILNIFSRIPRVEDWTIAKYLRIKYAQGRRKTKDRPHYGPEVDSASNGNEYQQSSSG
jgi:hypothetical protein